MRLILALAVFPALLLGPAPSAEGAGADRLPVALSVAPARLAIAAPASRRITVRNDGAEQVVIAVRRTPAKDWLQVAPARLLINPGRSAVLTLRATHPRNAEPGDHRVLVLLTTHPPRASRVTLHVRLGVRIDVRMPGRIVRRLALGGLRVSRMRGGRFMILSVANRGNVTVQLRGQVTASLFRRGRRVARLSPPRRRMLLPGVRAMLTLRYGGPARGPVTAVVRVRLGPTGRPVERSYRIRL